MRTQHNARRRQERSREKQQDQQKQRERIQYMSQGAFNNGGMVGMPGMPPPPNFGVAGPQNLFQPNGQVMNPLQYNQVFQNPAYQQQPSYQPQVAGLVQQLLQVLQPNNSNDSAGYNNYQTQQYNVPVFDPRDAFALANPYSGSQNFNKRSSTRSDGSGFAEFMSNELDGSKLNGHKVDNRSRGC